MGIENDPKKLLKQLKNVTLVEVEREDECCGFGGTFAVKEPQNSAAMVKDKIEDIKQTGDECLLGADCGCLLNISGAMQHSRMEIDHQHVAEFIWQLISKKRYKNSLYNIQYS